MPNLAADFAEFERFSYWMACEGAESADSVDVREYPRDDLSGRVHRPFPDAAGEMD